MAVSASATTAAEGLDHKWVPWDLLWKPVHDAIDTKSIRILWLLGLFVWGVAAVGQARWGGHIDTQDMAIVLQGLALNLFQAIFALAGVAVACFSIAVGSAGLQINYHLLSQIDPEARKSGRIVTSFGIAYGGMASIVLWIVVLGTLVGLLAAASGKYSFILFFQREFICDIFVGLDYVLWQGLYISLFCILLSVFVLIKSYVWFVFTYLRDMSKNAAILEQREMENRQLQKKKGEG